MFFRSLFLPTAICFLAMPCVVSQGQDSPPIEISGGPPEQVLDIDPNNQGEDANPVILGLDGEPLDPTMPPSHLLDRIPKQEMVPSANPPKPPTEVKSTMTRKPVARNQPVVPLPALPQITLRGIVLSTPERGTVMLNVNERTVNIALIPLESQLRSPIPKNQFSSMQAALNQRFAMNKAASSERDDENSKPKQYEMCLQCSFASEDGVIFNVEAFTRDTVLLRAIPHDTLVIVRK